MARRKSVCIKWTLVLIVVIVCPFVNSRPQEVLSHPSDVSNSKISTESEKSTENPIRYRYNNRNLSLDSHKSPIVISNVHLNNNSNYNLYYISELTTKRTRKTRLILDKPPIIHHYRKNDVTNNRNSVKNKNVELNSHDKKKSSIRKVITKWTDTAKFDDLDFTYETTTSEENYFTNAVSNDETFNNDNSQERSTEVAEKVFYPQDIKKLYDIIYKKHKNKPKPQYSGTQIYSDNVFVTDRFHQPTTIPPYMYDTSSPSPIYNTNIRPIYIFTTPTPTPIITNVGNPTPWQTQHFQTYYHKPTTQKPITVTKPLKYQNNYIHTYPHYPGTDYEVSTFQPTSAYTDRIVIRPEEYSGSPDECPTIFLTLNNTFQGQAKEACPDLNIAVNTNVINKNVVVESEEEEEEEEGDTDGDSLFPGSFDIPFEDESSDEEGHTVYDSEDQEQSDSASIEGQALTNYNSANVGQPEPSEPIALGSNYAAAIHRPGKPSNDDDDILSPFSSVLQFFRPALNALNWLATINPFTFGLLSILLSPIMFLFAGTSGVAALFAPWAFSGRESNKIVHVYRPYWHWDNEMKTWSLHTFENDRMWAHSYSRNSRDDSLVQSSIQPTLFYKFKQWMKAATRILHDTLNNMKSYPIYRKNKRKKRETWTRRIK